MNQSTNKQKVINEVLHAFLSMTHFETGWVFLTRSNRLELAADAGLPPALARDDKELMCGEDCTCVSRYKKGHLTQATSIIGCKRIEHALARGDEDIAGITHHATVPLKTPTQTYGLLNVAAPYQKEYKSELELLESVALQIGTALERIERFEQEERRSELLTRVHLFTKQMQETTHFNELESCFSNGLFALFQPDDVTWLNEGTAKEDSLSTTELAENISPSRSVYMNRETPFSVMEKEVFHLLLDYYMMTYKQLQLHRKEMDLARIEERSRLAQDLHDSVSQLLFSIVLTSQASRQLAHNEAVDEHIQYIYDVSSQALKEMRALIAKQKGDRLKEGLLAELTHYAGAIGIKLETESSGTTPIPYAIEETMLRIGQEALHNIKKHADSNEALIHLLKEKEHVNLIIKDEGKGFDRDAEALSPSFGIRGMKERAALYNGTMSLQSSPGEGTEINVTLPYGGDSVD
nr:GAF domain-containing sensor histidine kinase [Thalassobacillus sp. CUG 92003]